MLQKDLHQREIQLLDLLYAGVSGIAGTAGIVISALRQEVHILRLYNVFQVGGDTYILGQLLYSIHSSSASLVQSHIVHALNAHGLGNIPVFLTGGRCIVGHHGGQDNGVGYAVRGVIHSAQRVRQTFRLLLKVCLGYALVLWACIQLFPGAFARIFTPEPELVAFTAGMLRIYCGALFLMGIQIACQMTFVSIGNAPCSIVVAVLRKFVLLLPLIYLLPHLLADQTRAVFLAEPVADTIAVTGTVLLFSFQFRKALRRLEGDNKS